MKPMEGLSHREAEVLELVGRRLSNPQIAERLSMSVRTVKRHVASLIRKFGVADRRAVATYPAETGGPARGVSGDRPARAGGGHPTVAALHR